MNFFFKKPSPQELLAKLNAAYDLMQQNRLSEALNALNKIIKQSPENAKAFAYRGEVNGRLGNIPAALADLQKSVHLRPTPEAYFNFALAHLHANDPNEALAALFRVVQLAPMDKEAWSLRQQLANDLGLAELEQTARAVEQFAYAQCGPGFGWQVELRKMYRFMPNKTHEEYNAVLLDLCQQPAAFVQIETVALEYKVVLNFEKSSPDIPQATFIDVITKIIPANNDSLLAVLNGFVQDGVLVKENHCLRYKG